MKRRWGQARTITVRAVAAYNEDQGGRLAASLAYRAVFALAPLLLVAVSVAGFVFGTSIAQARLIGQIRPVAGEEVADIISDLLTQATSSRNATGVVGLAVLVWASSALFVEAQGSLDLVLGGTTPVRPGLRSWIGSRLVAAAISLLMGVVLLAVFAVNSARRFIGDMLAGPGASRLLPWIGGVGGLLVLTGAFALVFRLVPQRTVPWPAARIGGVIAGVGFVATTLLIGQYFDPDRFSGTGFAGGFALILFSVYVLAQIVLFGAEVIDVYLRDRAGSGLIGAGVSSDELSPVAVTSDHLPARRWSVATWFVAGFASGAYWISKLRRDR